jgi:predicted PurR-regulated permease PerM
VALVVGIALWLLWVVRVVVPPLLLAGVIVLLLNPLVVRLERKGVPRVAATALLYLAGVAVLVVTIVAVVPVVRDQVEGFRAEWPEVRERVEAWIDDRERDASGTPLEFSREELGDQFNSDVIERLPQLLRVGDRILGLVIVMVTGPVIAFYLLSDLPRIRRQSVGLVPPQSKDEILHLSRRLHGAVGGFVRGQILVATIVGVLISAGLAVLGVPFWALLGLIAGVADLVPLIGPVVGGVLAVVVTLVTRDVGTALWVVGVMVVVQQFESHIISPLVLHKTVKLHPAVVLMALLAGASLGGIFGMLVAAPIAAGLKIVIGHLWCVHVLERPPEGMEVVEEEEDGAAVEEEVGAADDESSS